MADANKNTNRVSKFDNIKFLLIMLVVMGHFIDECTDVSDVYRSIFVFIYSFHMPLFFVVSGYFHRDKNIKNKVIFYIMMGFTAKMIVAAGKLFIKGETPKVELFSDKGFPWFMFVMAFYVLISYALRDVNRKGLLVFAVLLACLAGYDSGVGDFLYVSRIIVFYPFYLVGMLLNDRRFMEKLTELKIPENRFRMRCLVAVSVASIVIWAYLCFCRLDRVYIMRWMFTGRNSFSVKSAYLPYGFIYRLVAYTISTVLCFAVICLLPDVKIPGFTVFGANTLQIYLWHKTMVYILIKANVDQMLQTTAGGKILWLLLAVLTCYLLNLKVFAYPGRWIQRLAWQKEKKDNN
jgi:fucose 4-O-acetylase-like acetyltransferase